MMKLMKYSEVSRELYRKGIKPVDNMLGAYYPVIMTSLILPSIDHKIIRERCHFMSQNIDGLLYMRFW